MYGIIYGIENLINHKIYVGQTIRKLNERMCSHRSSKTSLIGKAIRKYGWENFVVVTIEECETAEQLNEREMYWIAKLNCKTPKGYNRTDGGDGAKGCVCTAETRAKMGAAQKGRKLSPETRAKISAFHKGNKYWLGRKHTEEEKRKIGESNKGKHFDRIGKKDSPETRAKKSLAQMGNTKGRGNKGRPKSEEQKAKISASLMGNIPWNKGKKTGQIVWDKGKERTTSEKANISAAVRKVLYPVLDDELIRQQLTYRDIANGLGVARETIGGKLRGSRKLDEKTARAIKELLGVEMPLEELFKRNDA